MQPQVIQDLLLRPTLCFAQQQRPIKRVAACLRQKVLRLSADRSNAQICVKKSVASPNTATAEC